VTVQLAASRKGLSSVSNYDDDDDDRCSPDSVVGIATVNGLDGRVVEVEVPVGAKFLFSPHRPDRPWGPPSLISIGYRGLFHGGEATPE
jgi:hypothetical protein